MVIWLSLDIIKAKPPKTGSNQSKPDFQGQIQNIENVLGPPCPILGLVKTAHSAKTQGQIQNMQNALVPPCPILLCANSLLFSSVRMLSVIHGFGFPRILNVLMGA